MADASSVGVTTIRRAETVDGVPSTTKANITVLQQTLEQAGVDFIDENGGGVGVRLKKSR